MGSLRVGHDWATSVSLFTFTFCHFLLVHKVKILLNPFFCHSIAPKGVIQCQQSLPCMFLTKASIWSTSDCLLLPESGKSALLLHQWYNQQNNHCKTIKECWGEVKMKIAQRTWDEAQRVLTSRRVACERPHTANHASRDDGRASDKTPPLWASTDCLVNLAEG